MACGYKFPEPEHKALTILLSPYIPPQDQSETVARFESAISDFQAADAAAKERTAFRDLCALIWAIRAIRGELADIMENGDVTYWRKAASARAAIRYLRQGDPLVEHDNLSDALGNFLAAAETARERMCARTLWRSKRRANVALCLLFVRCTGIWREATGEWPCPKRVPLHTASWARTYAPDTERTHEVFPLRTILDGIVGERAPGMPLLDRSAFRIMTDEARRACRRERRG
jgi:hypothetical protein